MTNLEKIIRSGIRVTDSITTDGEEIAVVSYSAGRGEDEAALICITTTVTRELSNFDGRLERAIDTVVARAVRTMGEEAW